MGLYSQSCHEFEAKTTTLHRQHYSLSFFSIVNVDRHHQPVIGCKQCVIFICQGIFWHIKISHSHSHVMIPIPNPVPIRSSKLLPILMGFPGESNPHGNSHSHEHLLHVIYFFLQVAWSSSSSCRPRPSPERRLEPATHSHSWSTTDLCSFPSKSKEWITSS